MTDEVVVPDVAETLLAFRVWRWDRGTPLTLWSLNATPPRRRQRTGLGIRKMLANPESGWPTDGVLVARCELKRDDDDEPHQPPGEKCLCGVYAATDIDVIAGYIREAPVLGLVQASGKVVPAELGYRAARMTITCLFAIDQEFTIARRDLQKLADGYDVPLIRPYSAQPEDYRDDVRDGFARHR